MLDIQKAFDTVSHRKLIYKLRELNIPDPICDWLSIYLEGRSFQVKIGEHFSASRMISSGVPQGSICGPLLFSLYIAELPTLSIPPVTSGLFADDNKLGAPATDEGNAALSATLQSIGNWFTNWQLVLSIEKCAHLIIGKQLNATATFSLQGADISKVNECRDLGLLVDRNLNFKQHIDVIVKKAFRKSYQVRKSFGTHDAQVLTRLFTAYVRPSLEYGSMLWSPHTQNQITKIERVQRKFTKIILRKRDLSYTDRLRILNLQTLAIRRKINDLLLLHSIFYKHVNIPFVNNIIVPVSNRTRGNSLRLSTLHRSRSDVVKYSWLHRAIRDWNCLPDELVRTVIVGSFKSKLFSHFDLTG